MINQTRFEVKNLPRDDQPVRVLLHLVRRQFCLAECIDHPYLYVVLDQGTKFMDHYFDAEDFTQICCEEDTGTVSGPLTFDRIDSNGYAYYHAGTLHELSRIRPDQSGGETIAWAQLTRIRNDGSEDFYFNHLPIQDFTPGTKVLKQWPNPRPEQETLFRSVFARVAFQGPTATTSQYAIQSYTNTKTDLVEQTIEFPAQVQPIDCLPGYLLFANWLKPGGGSEPVLVPTTLLGCLRHHWLSNLAHDKFAATSLGNVSLTMHLTPNLPNNQWMSKRWRAYYLCDVVRAPTHQPQSNQNHRPNQQAAANEEHEENEQANLNQEQIA